MTGPRLALTLPTFSEGPEALVAVAKAADATPEIDAVFTYDHLYRIRSGGEGPSLSLEPVLGLLAAETGRLSFGPFMARATVRPPALLRTVLTSVHRIAPGRLIAGIGAGDSDSDPENEMFGVPGGDVTTRLAALEATVEAVTGHGFPVWVGGTWDPVLAVAASHADGWNSWNTRVETFAGEWGRLRRACETARRDPAAVVPTWGGLVELRPDRWEEAAARPDVLSGGWDEIAEGLRAYVAAGARWLVVAPLAAADPGNVDALAQELAPRLRG